MSHLNPRGDNLKKKNNGNDKPIVTISEGDWIIQMKGHAVLSE